MSIVTNSFFTTPKTDRFAAASASVSISLSDHDAYFGLIAGIDMNDLLVKSRPHSGSSLAGHFHLSV